MWEPAFRVQTILVNTRGIVHIVPLGCWLPRKTDKYGISIASPLIQYSQHTYLYYLCIDIKILTFTGYGLSHSQYALLHHKVFFTPQTVPNLTNEYYTFYTLLVTIMHEIPTQ